MAGAGNPVANPVAQAIDGATGDWSMSGDAMRWSPELAERGAAAGELRGLESAVGLGGGLGLDMTGVRRMVSGALSSLGSVASDVVTELRQLALGPPPSSAPSLPPAEDADTAP
jgi:hypothetical protein